MMINQDNFFVIAREPGAQNPAIPTWAARNENGLALTTDTHSKPVTRVDISEVPGTYQLHNLLSADECQHLIQLSESLGYLADAAVSLPRNIRHNDNLTLVIDDVSERILWQRVRELVNQNLAIFNNKPALGINTRFRFYRYQQGDYFSPHIDGDWPGSRVEGEQLVTNAYDDRYSRMTFLILLNDTFEGGATRFLLKPEEHRAENASFSQETTKNHRQVDVRTPTGGVLLFPHGRHPLHCVHSSTPITQGVKYIIRTDLLFAL